MPKHFQFAQINKKLFGDLNLLFRKNYNLRIEPKQLRKFVLHRSLCVVFCKKCFMKLKTESKAEI